ncbi:hypothetical protein EDC01DRAFT_181200 [Geopyxis carbonaria]|nr:hypothetical protein EDC01DRAFT_181200 [Geopyxis carbonaria]
MTPQFHRNNQRNIPDAQYGGDSMRLPSAPPVRSNGRGHDSVQLGATTHRHQTQHYNLLEHTSHQHNFQAPQTRHIHGDPINNQHYEPNFTPHAMYQPVVSENTGYPHFHISPQNSPRPDIHEPVIGPYKTYSDGRAARNIVPKLVTPSPVDKIQSSLLTEYQSQNPESSRHTSCIPAQTLLRASNHHVRHNGEQNLQPVHRSPKPSEQHLTSGEYSHTNYFNNDRRRDVSPASTISNEPASSSRQQQCKMCGGLIDSINSLRYHVSECLDKKNLMCPVRGCPRSCEFPGGRFDNLIQHVRNKHEWFIPKRLYLDRILSIVQQ